MAGQPIKDMHGFKIGKLEVVSFAGSDDRVGQRRAYWNVRCTCGTVKEYAGSTLRRGTVRSCGCSQHLKRPRHPNGWFR